MVRKLNLIIIMFMSMLLIPIPLYARGGFGGGHGGFGGHGFGGGHSSFGGHGFGGYGGFNSGHFGGYRGFNGSGWSGFSGRSGSWGHGFSGHNGFNNSGHFGGHNGGNFNNFNHGGFHHGHHEEFEENENFIFASSFFLGFGFGALAAYPFWAYPYYGYPYYGYPYYGYPYDYPYAGSYTPGYGDPPPDPQSYGDLGIQMTPEGTPNGYTYDAPQPNSQSYGNLEIHVAPENAEIYVDGRFIGQANDFQGPAVLSVPEGTHIVEFRYNGFSSSTTVNVNSGSNSVIQEHIGNSPKGGPI